MVFFMWTFLDTDFTFHPIGVRGFSNYKVRRECGVLVCEAFSLSGLGRVTAPITGTTSYNFIDKPWAKIF